MAESLKVEHFISGDDATFYYYGDNPENKSKYGNLYTWNTLKDSRGLIPKGWHVPSLDEMKLFVDYVGIANAAYIKAKYGWNTSNVNNITEFSLVGGGFKATPLYEGNGVSSVVWCLAGDGVTNFNGLFIEDNSSNVAIRNFTVGSGVSEFAFYIRCIKDY